MVLKRRNSIGELIVRLRTEKQKTQDETSEDPRSSSFYLYRYTRKNVGQTIRRLGRCLARDLEPSPLVLKMKNPRDKTRGREGCQYLKELNDFPYSKTNTI
jgi:hypothetical protein